MKPSFERLWVSRFPEAESIDLRPLTDALKIAPLTARVLWARGITSPDEGRRFLEGRLAELPDPFLMRGMEEAVDRLCRALEHQETMTVHGDYDVDGITGTSLLVDGLQRMGASVNYHIPLRLKDGYGLSAAALQKAAQEGASLCLSVDCGITACDEARLAKDLGLDLIITDHHHPSARLPEALAILNPHQAGCEFPYKDLAGVGVAFFLLIGLRKRLRENGYFVSRPEPDLRKLLDLVALGTIADVVPLKGVNRILVKTGLVALGHNLRPGVARLREVAAVKEVSCGAVGFRLAPRLNAAGRIEDARKGVELLLTTDPEQARVIAMQLDNFNRERQNIEQQTLHQAIERLDDLPQERKTIVLADERWHPGVIGIVASRLVERYHRPTVLIALDGEGQGKGSARSVAGFHLYDALEHCREHLEGFGGHAFAAGLSLSSEAVPLFSDRFESVASEALTPDDLIPRALHDGEMLIEDLSGDIVRELARLAPFGAGNAEPVFLYQAVRAQQRQIVGENHLRMTVRQGGYSTTAIAFGMADRIELFGEDVDLLAVPSLNEWKETVTLQLRIKDVRRAAPCN
ncbi:MAG TPA: single-stranded-DNA-specific exonuclease RecJ [Desulfuromonadales bacterium]|nr:single-stranded-DNA-specific exonuclease RecJ [Desulfuromonadales bacterium]